MLQTFNHLTNLLYILQHAYTIQNECRGKVFIINNVHFDGPLQNRDASNMDAENLTTLFSELHFTVFQEQDLTAKVIRYQ